MTSLIGGFKDRKIESRSKVEPATLQYIGRYRQALDVLSQLFYELIASDAVEANSTTSAINATSHLAIPGDIILFTSGALQYEFCVVLSTTTNVILLSQTLDSTPATSVTFDILRPSIPRVSGGSILTVPFATDSAVWTAVSASDIVNTVSTAVKSAGGAGVCYYITSITVSNMSASVATRVDILDGSTVIWSGPASAGGGGYSITFPRPKKLTANTAINAQCGTASAQVRVAIAGYSGT